MKSLFLSEPGATATTATPCCARCGGPYRQDYALDRESGDMGEWFSGIPLLTCLMCGAVTDPVIEAHHALARPTPILCACGCGDEVRAGRQYLLGHHTRGARVQGHRTGKQRKQ